MTEAPDPVAPSVVTQAARTTGMSPRRLRALLAAGVIDGLDFAALAWLRNIATLEPVPSPATLGAALSAWRRHAGPDAKPSAVVWRWHAKRLVAADPAGPWEPTSGQGVLQLDAAAPTAAPHRLDTHRQARAASSDRAALHARLEAAAQRAGEGAVAGCRAYAQILREHPTALPACLNLGRLLHALGKLHWAQGLYARAAQVHPEAATPWFNLGVVSEDLGRLGLAAGHYRQALMRAPTLPDAHFNLARLCELEGDQLGATRHWVAFRRYRARH